MSERYTTWWLDICVYCKMISTIRLVKISITSYSYNFFVCMLRTFKICSLSNFQVYNTVLLTLLYITSSELTHHISGSYMCPLCLLTTFTTLPSATLQPPVYFLFLWVCWVFFDYTYKWDHTLFGFLWLISLSMTISRSICVAASGIFSFFL